MSDISVNWVSVSDSALRRLLQLGALAVTGASGAALPLVLLSVSQEIAAAGAACAALLAVASGRRATLVRGAAWSVGRDGRVSVRWDGAADPQPATAAFVSPFLIVLRRGRRILAIWRDAAPAVAYRRLSAAVRWRAPRESAPDTTGRPDAADRT